MPEDPLNVNGDYAGYPRHERETSEFWYGITVEGIAGADRLPAEQEHPLRQAAYFRWAIFKFPSGFRTFVETCAAMKRAFFAY